MSLDDDFPFHKFARPTGKLADVVAAKIEREIIELGWPVGKVLGSEATLIQKYKVSRAVFREAVRLLEAGMVARMRPGPNGGLLVITPDLEGVAHTMALFLTYKKVSIRQLLDMRGLVESHAAALAAENASPEEREKLKELLDNERTNVEQDWKAANAFHILVAEMSGSPACALIAKSLIILTEQQTIPSRTRKTVAKNVHDIHRSVGQAILDGNVEQAKNLMAKHICALDPWLGEASQVRGKKKASRSAT